MLFRHGDVLIGKVKKLPTSAKPVNHLTLAQGEMTGHSHRIKEKKAAKMFRGAGELFLQVVAKRATVIHQEHAPIQLPTGIYRVWIQREYTPERIVRVRD
jgi:hypothetical protein